MNIPFIMSMNHSHYRAAGWSMRFVCVAAVIVVVGLVVGCGRGSGPVVQYVEGTVLLDGQPLEGATVGLSPTQGSAGLPAFARTDAVGVFRVTSTRGGSRDAGAAVGDYVVTVSKVVSDVPPPSDDVNDPEYGKKRSRPTPQKPPRNIVPELYGEVETSPLRMTVQRGANRGSAFVYELTTDRAAAARTK